MKKLGSSLILGVVCALSLNAQLGSIDSSFNVGSGFGPDRWTGRCEAILQQPDGKLLVSGEFSEFNGDTLKKLLRLNLDGSRDPSFTFSNSYGLPQGWLYSIKALALQSDGKILIGGDFDEVEGQAFHHIARLNSDGSLDQSFNPASGFDQAVHSIAVQPDGKIVVGGLFSRYDFVSGGAQVPVSGIARLNPDGSLDGGFNTGTGFGGGTGIGQRQVFQLALQPDGKILVGGQFGSFNGDTCLLLTRLHSDGSRDLSFNANANFAPVAGFYGQVYGLKLLPNGQIIISGNYGNNASPVSGLDRLHADGRVDTAFRISHSTDLRCFAFDRQADGKLLAASRNFGLPSEAYVLERIKLDGSLDSSFPKRFVNEAVQDIVVQQDGNITFVGYFNYNPIGIMRLIGDTPSGLGRQEKTVGSFALFPNPAQDLVFLSAYPAGAQLLISDLQGREWHRQSLPEGGFTINTGDFVPGLYLVQILFQDQVYRQKLRIALRP